MEFDINSRYFDADENRESGQCFRWVKTGNGRTAVLFDDIAMLLEPGADNITHIYAEQAEPDDEKMKESCKAQKTGKPVKNADRKRLSDREIRDKVMNYLDFDTDYEAVIAVIDPEDIHLTEAANENCGIRILNQDLWEIMISFMISQNNNIPRIRKSVAGICRRFGKKIRIPDFPGEWPDDLLYTFPGPKDIDPEDLSGLGLGYRDEYIHDLVLGAANSTVDLDYVKALASDKRIQEEYRSGKGRKKLNGTPVHDYLLTLKGIGNKVANCVELFGLHQIQAFPVDTWVRKIEEKYYGGRFPVEKYPETAGIMQQYLFFAERKS
ncbi:MAG: DNA glycosylase [Lachnospiraceae bacterium]|jgi:3-methyladenine DNA glycosylase/8-oxoguanine DNA glycosylase|nr:DNA glycosylase [Lachnospiraceae bacterium]MEE3460600.1 DNA glycosylase [Lachnospiraceae bacterium]